MLVEFQQALADLVASPQLCEEVGTRPDLLRERYRIDDLEWRRLTEIASHKGMAANCMLYRANRLAPLVMNLPSVCTALGPDLRAVVSAYWSACPSTDVHFLVESDRFRSFLLDALERGEFPDVDRQAVADALTGEGETLSLRLEASRAMGPMHPA